MTLEERLRKLEKVDLYFVTSEPLSAGRTSIEVLDAALSGGVRMVQLREKEKSKRELFELACVFRARTKEAGCLLIINDHLDVALATGADGVHLGQSDLPIDAARRIAPELILGASSHNLSQALAAQDAGASYVNIGPVFPTQTKPEHKTFLGPEAMGRIGGELRVPYSCMGGINEENIEQVVGAGAQIVAVVTAVSKAPDPAAAVRRLREILAP